MANFIFLIGSNSKYLRVDSFFIATVLHIISVESHLKEEKMQRGTLVYDLKIFLNYLED